MANTRKYHTPEELAEAKRVWRKRAATKVKNVTIDDDLVDTLNSKADSLEAVFGFRPTLSQTLRHLLKKSTG